MTGVSSYTAVRDGDGSYRLVRSTPPDAGATVARIKPVLDAGQNVTGWRLRPLVTMHGAKSHLWKNAAEAIAATRLMSFAQARRSVSAADARAGAP